MARTLAGLRTSVKRFLVQKYYMNFVAASSQRVRIIQEAANEFDGLSGATMVIRMRVNAVVSSGNYFASPNDSVQGMMTIKNTATTNKSFRVNFRAGGVAVNYDVGAGSSQKQYNLNEWMTIALRYTGSVIEFWVNGSKIDSRAASGAFGTTVTDWEIAAANASGFSSMDVMWARAWKSSLSDSNLNLAIAQNYITGACLNLDFTEGTGTPVDRGIGAQVILAGSPTWNALWSRTTA